jgi:hypothetical protein
MMILACQQSNRNASTITSKRRLYGSNCTGSLVLTDLQRVDVLALGERAILNGGFEDDDIVGMMMTRIMEYR